MPRTSDRVRLQLKPFKVTQQRQKWNSAKGIWGTVSHRECGIQTRLERTGGPLLSPLIMLGRNYVEFHHRGVSGNQLTK